MTSQLGSALSEGLREFSDQLQDDTKDIHHEVGSNLSAATNNLASTVERVKNAEVLAQLADKTKSSASALGSKLEGAITDADGVMKSVEGALAHAEGSASTLLSTGMQKLARACEAAGPSYSTVSPAKDPARGTVVLSRQRLDERIRAMETDASSFTSPVADPAAFDAWAANFEVLDHSEEIDRLLKERDGLRAVHASLVPMAMAYGAFWTRYHYNVHALTVQEERRLEVLRRAEAPTPPTKLSSWDFDDDDAWASDAPSTSASSPRRATTARRRQRRASRACRRHL